MICSFILVYNILYSDDMIVISSPGCSLETLDPLLEPTRKFMVVVGMGSGLQALEIG